MALLASGDDKQAIGALRKAVTVNDSAGNVAWGARARRLLARTLVKREPQPAAVAEADDLIRQADAALLAARLPASAASV